MPSPAIILINPQMGENIGAAARAMLNFGLTDLRLVAPRDGWPNAAATQTASGALDTITPQIFDTPEDAIADCHYTFITTARPRDMQKPSSVLEDAAGKCAELINEGQQTALVFGPERTGAHNSDVSLCDEVVFIDTNKDFASLNLGQAVLLSVYACANAINTHTNNQNTGNINDSTLMPPAPAKDFNAFFDRLEKELDDKRFFRDEGLKPTIVRNIRTTLQRARMSEQELRTMHGVLSALIGNKRGEN